MGSAHFLEVQFFRAHDPTIPNNPRSRDISHVRTNLGCNGPPLPRSSIVKPRGNNVANALPIKRRVVATRLPSLNPLRGQVGTTRASRHSVNPQQICFAEIRKYKNINSSRQVGVQSFNKIREPFCGREVGRSVAYQ